MDKNKPINKNYPKLLWYYALFGIIIWTLFIYLSFFWHQRAMHLGAVSAAQIEARSAHQGHLIYRSWNAMHGGVYVPVTHKTQPNTYLEDVERDIQTPSGIQLTKVNPSFMNRQVNALGFEKYGTIAHITSLNPIRPANKADEWETSALKQFENGATEITSVDIINGTEYMRLMRPLRTEKGCLNCHAKQGYKLGDIRGGISVAVLMEPHYQIEQKNITHFKLMYALLWLIGLFGTFVFMYVLNRQVQKRLHAEDELRQRDKLDGVVEMARAVCHQLNQPLQMIMGNTEILLLEDVDPETLKKRLNLIKEQVDRMGEMTGKIIKIANYETMDLPQGKLIDIEKSSRKKTDSP